MEASASGLTGNQQYFQAVLTKSGEASNYLGYTKGAGGWIVYKSSPDLATLLKINPVGGVWSGQVAVKVDTADSGFKGPGEYLVKLFKYVTSPNSHMESNALSITVNLAVPPPPPAPNPSPMPSPSPAPAPSPSPAPAAKAKSPPVIESSQVAVADANKNTVTNQEVLGVNTASAGGEQNDYQINLATSSKDSPGNPLKTRSLLLADNAGKLQGLPEILVGLIIIAFGFGLKYWHGATNQVSVGNPKTR